LLNNKDGTFAAPVTTNLNFNPNYVTAADVNGDGLPDLILSGANATVVNVLLNQGNASFGTPIPSSLGSASLSSPTVVADIDGDGLPDVLVAAGQDVGVLRNIGGGFFEPAVFVNGSPLGYNPAPFSVADVNNDGRLDVIAPDTAGSSNTFWIAANQTSQVCYSKVTPVSVRRSPAGGTGSLTVTAAASCSWAAATNEPWITITGGATGKGKGTVSYAVAANPDTARVGAISVADQSVVVTQAGSLPGLQLGTGSTISLGTSGATAVAAGDFNRDGKQDLAVAVNNGSSTELLILLGNGNGTFGMPVPYALNAATQLVVADVNEDGYPDLLAVTGGSFAVLLNSGNGTFAAPVYYTTGVGILNLAVGDFYRDGRVHVAVSTDWYGSVGVQVFQNLGNGEFVLTSTISGVGVWVAAADVNGDGYPDLVTANGAGSSYSVLLNNKDGTFAAPVTTNLNFNPNYVTAADVNGDGLPDLILTAQSDTGASVLLGQGNSTFGTPVRYPLETAIVGGTVVADVDGDGHPDLLIPTSTGIAVMRNLGAGAFEQEDLLLSGGYTLGSVATIELKGDGHLSVVTPDPVSGSNAVLLFSNTTPRVCKFAVTPGSVQLGSPAATTGMLTVTAASGCGWTATTNEPWLTITAGGTGKGNGTVSYAVTANPDTARVGAIAVADQNVPVTQVGSLPSLQLGTGSSISVGSSTATAVASADFNRDGKQDLAVAVNDGSSSQLLILLGKGDGTFAAPVAYTLNYATQLLAADVNEDGCPDLLAATGSSFAVLLNNCNGAFAAPTYYSTGASNLAVGDFYRDGRVHVALSGGGAVEVFQNLGNGEFVLTSEIAVPATWVAVADLNGDGYADLVTAYGNSSYSILLNNQDGTFATPVTMSFNASYVTAADVNGDGMPDLILTAQSDTGVSVALNQGKGTFGAPVRYPLETGIVGGTVVVDLDGDGRPDLLIPTNTGIAVMRNLGRGVFEQEDLLLTGGYSNGSLTTIDLKGDGHLSVVTPDPVSGSNAVLLFTNTTPQVCKFAVTPGSVQLTSPAATTGTLTVTAASGCAWTATTNEPWVTITAGGTGKGNGTVSYAVKANLDTARVGAIAVADQTITFTQAAAVVPISAIPSELGDLGSAVNGFVSADFNRDGLTDYAVATADGTLSVFLATAPGKFASPSKYSFGSSAFPTAADVNSDGYPDLVILSGGSVGVSINNGKGSFETPKYYSLADAGCGSFGGGTSMAVGDFKQNGHIDIAAISVDVFGACPLLNVFQNDGTGHFIAQSPKTLLGGAYDLITADVNNDGYPDLITSNGNGGNTVSFLLNQKNGTFKLQSPLDIVAGPIAAADLNGDGYPDLVLYNGALNLEVYFGVGDGTFGPPTSYVLPGGAHGRAIVADIDGDGKPDVVLPTGNSLSILRNLGKGALELRQYYTTTSTPTAMDLADLNDDGKVDILANAGPTEPTSTTYWLYTNKTKQVCGFSVKPNNILLTTPGTVTETFSVTAAGSCQWQAVSHSPWLTVLSGSTGQGSGTVDVLVNANTAKTGRVGTLSIADSTVVITQPGQ
jgi:hypothetical protein